MAYSEMAQLIHSIQVESQDGITRSDPTESLRKKNQPLKSGTIVIKVQVQSKNIKPVVENLSIPNHSILIVVIIASNLYKIMWQNMVG